MSHICRLNPRVKQVAAVDQLYAALLINVHKRARTVQLYVGFMGLGHVLTHSATRRRGQGAIIIK